MSPTEHSSQHKKILVVTPRFPFDLCGACEQDRAQGISILKQLGYTVHVVTMCYQRQLADIAAAEKKWEITITPILYSKVRLSATQKYIRKIQQILFPPFWDGAAYEYRDAETQKIVEEQVTQFKPDLVWFDYTYLWPLYHIARLRNIPIITRSINFEPAHYLGKTNKTIIDYLKYVVKVQGEKKMLAMSNLVFSITPKEKITYERLGKIPVVNLPLRRLSQFIGMNAHNDSKEKLNVCFMGSNYTVHHMLQGLLFILEKVNPLLQERYPDAFTIHIIGGKIPASVSEKKFPNVQMHGYVPDLNTFLADIDIALSPSLSGEGMQQKVFEPIVRGIPTVTSARAMACYPFFDGIHIITATEDPESFVHALGNLRDASIRKKLSQNAIRMAENQFSETLYKDIIKYHITKVLS